MSKLISSSHSEKKNNLTHPDNSSPMKQPHQHPQCAASPADPEQSIPSMPHSFSDAPSPQIQNYLSSGNQRKWTWKKKLKTPNFLSKHKSGAFSLSSPKECTFSTDNIYRTCFSETSSPILQVNYVHQKKKRKLVMEHLKMGNVNKSS